MGITIPQHIIDHITQLLEDTSSMTEAEIESASDNIYHNIFNEIEEKIKEIYGNDISPSSYETITQEMLDNYSFDNFDEYKHVPLKVTRLQARLALIEVGLWDTIVEYFSSPERTAYEIAFFEDAQNWERTDPIVQSVSESLNLTEEQFNNLFISAYLK